VCDSQSACAEQIGNAGVQYNNPQVSNIPQQKSGSLFPGEGVRPFAKLYSGVLCLSALLAILMEAEVRNRAYVPALS
jgi:hypothetical protein